MWLFYNLEVLQQILKNSVQVQFGCPCSVNTYHQEVTEPVIPHENKVITRSCGIKICSFVSSQSTRVTDRRADRRTDGQTDRITTPKTALA